MKPFGPSSLDFCKRAEGRQGLNVSSALGWVNSPALASVARMRSFPGGSISSDVLRAAMRNQEVPAVGLVGLINSSIVAASN